MEREPPMAQCYQHHFLISHLLATYNHGKMSLVPKLRLRFCNFNPNGTIQVQRQRPSRSCLDSTAQADLRLPQFENSITFAATPPLISLRLSTEAHHQHQTRIHLQPPTEPQRPHHIKRTLPSTVIGQWEVQYLQPTAAHSLLLAQVICLGTIAKLSIRTQKNQITVLYSEILIVATPRAVRWRTRGRATY